jgi:hypothetical protein
MKNSVAIVTGASQGIGRSTAIVWLKIFPLLFSSRGMALPWIMWQMWFDRRKLNH